ncbi:MAG: hypothetical protein K0U66_04225 [Gammaproteobacteria bacterium]|nr:hypothetical protein [Gammaproteobacteria bacterium]
MAGLKSLNEAFKVGEVKLHLNSPSGALPLYLATHADGKIEAVVGTWEQGEISTQAGLYATDPVAPLPPKGGRVEPVLLTIRNGESPDAERFRQARGVDAKAEMRGKAKPKGKAKLSDEDKERILYASCIVGFENIPEDGEDGETRVMKFTEDNAIQLLIDHPITITQINLLLGDKKKFESSSATG